MSHGSERSAGVCILRNRFNGEVLFSDCDKDGHFIFLVLEIANLIYILVSVYGFNSQAENVIYIDRKKTAPLALKISKFFNTIWLRFQYYTG